MYAIYKQNRKFNNKTFKTYEQARSYVRKFLRNKADSYFNTNSMFTDAGWVNHSNPSHSLYSFTIRNV